jgi:hypothetical protein
LIPEHEQFYFHLLPPTEQVTCLLAQTPHKLHLQFNIQTQAHLLKVNHKLLALEPQIFEFPERQHKYFQFLIRHQECAFIQLVHLLLTNTYSSISSHCQSHQLIPHFVVLAA